MMVILSDTTQEGLAASAGLRVRMHTRSSIKALQRHWRPSEVASLPDLHMKREMWPLGSWQLRYR